MILELGGAIAGSQPMVTISDPTSKILSALSNHTGTGVWVGAYMELASLAAFAIFAAWLFRQRPRALSIAGLLTAGSYIAITISALVAGDAIAFGASHGLVHQQMLALFYLQSGLFIASWGIAAAFLALAPTTGWLRRSAQVTAGLLLIAMAAPTAGAAQVPNMLFLIWALVASLSLARRPRLAALPTPATAAA